MKFGNSFRSLVRDPVSVLGANLVSHPIRGLKDSNVEYRPPPSEQYFEIQKDLPQRI